MRNKNTALFYKAGFAMDGFPGADSSRRRTRRLSSRKPATVNDPASQALLKKSRLYSRVFSLAAGLAWRQPAANVLFCVWLFVSWSVPAADQSFKPDVYMEIADAPRAVFPKATAFERRDVKVTSEMSQKIKSLVGSAKPTIWESSYITFIAKDAQGIIGYAVICEEIGKHYPMTFIVGVTPDGQVEDVAMIAYREPQGGEVRYKGFTKQFQKKTLKNPIMPYKDVVNISGATLSVRAMTRGVRKALAVIQTIYLDAAPQRAKEK